MAIEDAAFLSIGEQIPLSKSPDWGVSHSGQPLTYDSSEHREGCRDLLGLSLPVPPTTSWRAEIDGKRFSRLKEIDGSLKPKVWVSMFVSEPHLIQSSNWRLMSVLSFSFKASTPSGS
jgi:hypothetical protein